jgi:TFIIF-interacting CTD phosphatase-like protein
LYREDCVVLQGLYIKDLSRLGRPLELTAIVDNSPASYLLQPQCAVAVKSWFNDSDDRELARLLPALSALAASEQSVAEWRASWWN